MPSSPELSAHEQLLRLQRATFARLVEDVVSKRHRESKQLRLYRSRYDREVKRFRKISSKLALVEKVSSASIVFCGDYHTLRQSQRTLVKLLRPIVGERKNIILALEMIRPSSERFANDFVRRKIDDKTFLEKTEYSKRWGFSWGHYKQIFEFAREHNLKIIGLNSDEGDKQDLETRDDYAAKIIAKATISSPESLVFCLYGDLHVASTHIPGRVHALLKEQKEIRSTLTIFQNSEPIYWLLAEKGLESTVDVVEISPDQFCVLSASPWIKWQSYQTWLEDQSELMDAPEEAEIVTPDFYHQVLELAQKLATFLNLKNSNLEHFSVFTASDTKLIDRIETYCRNCRHKDFPVEATIRAELVENRSLFVPDQSILYLSDLSLNRAAEKAAQLILSKLSPRIQLFEEGTDSREIFYRLVLWNAVGFLGSKIMNPKRKTDHYKDFEIFIVKSRRSRLRGHQKDQRDTALALLGHRKYELETMRTGRVRGAPRKLYRLPPRIFFLTTNALGQILADQLYFAMVHGRIPLDQIRDLFLQFPPRQKSAVHRYFELLKFVRKQMSESLSKNDRF